MKNRHWVSFSNFRGHNGPLLQETRIYFKSATNFSLQASHRKEKVNFKSSLGNAGHCSAVTSSGKLRQVLGTSWNPTRSRRKRRKVRNHRSLERRPLQQHPYSAIIIRHLAITPAQQQHQRSTANEEQITSCASLSLSHQEVQISNKIE